MNLEEEWTWLYIFRHGPKGDGIITSKLHLSTAGMDAAFAAGIKLLESIHGEITYVGGSDESRSLMTALLIAWGAKANPKVLASKLGLGSEKQFFSWTTAKEFDDALKANGNNMTKATKAVLSTENIETLKRQMFDVVVDYGTSLTGNIVLGTHNPWLQLFLEAITGTEYGNAPELSHVTVKVNRKTGKIHLVETDLIP